MKRSIRAALVLAVLLAADAPAQDAIPRIVDVRIGQHRAYDRIVLELDQAAPITRQPAAPGDDVVIEIGARPLLPRQEIATGSPRFESVTLEGTFEGARLQLRGGRARVRVFWLAGPPRLVIDVAEEGEAPFEPPPGTESVEPLPRETIEAIPAEPEAVEVTPEAGVPLGEQLEELGAVEPSPETPSPTEFEEDPLALAPPEEPTPRAEMPSEPLPEQVAPPVGLPPQPLPPELAPLPMPPPKPEGIAPEEGRFDRWLSLLVWVGVPMLLVGLGLYLTRARRRGVEEVAEPRPPESITPGEVMSASDRLDLVEKRIDEEVRARMQLEHRVVMVQEDLKVVRDRVIRFGRRGEVPS